MSDQSKTNRTNRVLPRLLIFMAVVTIGLVVASAAFAAWTTIGFGGGIDTAAWGAASYSELTNDAGIDDRYDIKNAWVRYDGSYIYFRIETFGNFLQNSPNYRAIGAIDCTGDGSFTDPDTSSAAGDRLVLLAPDGSVILRDGASTNPIGTIGSASGGELSDIVTVNGEWGIPLLWIPPTCRGSTEPRNVKWVIANFTGSPVTIDESSTTVALSNPMDYGDTQQTLNPPTTPCATGSPFTGLQCDGARHGILPPTPGGQPLRLGSAPVDADTGGLQSAGSDADDTSGTTPDDEGGIAPDPANSWSDGGGAVLFTIQGTTGDVRMSCWVDFNKNGVWTDMGEAVFVDQQFVAGATNKTFQVPAGLTWGNSFPARCRIWPSPGDGTSSPVSGPSGAIEFGEVEDHIWQFGADGRYIAPNAPSAVTNLAIAASGTNDVKLTWTNPAPNDGARVLGHATNPYFTSATGGFAVDALDSAAPWEYVHAGVRGAPAGTVYYTVYGRLGATDATAASNRVGLFEFGLTAGIP